MTLPDNARKKIGIDTLTVFDRELKTAMNVVMEEGELLAGHAMSYKGQNVNAICLRENHF